jgi:hypothetical protein
LTIKLTAECLDADLRELLRILSRGAIRHRDTVMLGRTHGQPGVPITFGFKQAQWGEELARSRDRLDEGRRRWETAQLGGSVGSLAFWGADAPALMDAFARRIGLAAPVLPWASARDCVAEFGVFAALLGASLAKIGNEICQLQRPEIGELGEEWTGDQIGSVTMPQKRNPERSEQLVTLGRLLRSYALVLLESAVVEHERDGRAWKAEWVALPDVCCAVTRASSLCVKLLASLEVHADRMHTNVGDRGGVAMSERGAAARAASGKARRVCGGAPGRCRDAGRPVRLPRRRARGGCDGMSGRPGPRAAARPADRCSQRRGVGPGLETGPEPARHLTSSSSLCRRPGQLATDLAKSATTVPRVSPASSGMLCPALASRTCGWPLAPGTSPWNIASAAPPIGSCSP